MFSGSYVQKHECHLFLGTYNPGNIAPLEKEEPLLIESLEYRSQGTKHKGNPWNIKKIGEDKGNIKP